MSVSRICWCLYCSTRAFVVRSFSILLLLFLYNLILITYPTILILNVSFGTIKMWLSFSKKKKRSDYHFLKNRCGGCLDTNEKLKLFYYLVYFYYYLWVSLYFLVLFMSHIVLFQLTFTFISIINFQFQQNKRYRHVIINWDTNYHFLKKKKKEMW